MFIRWSQSVLEPFLSKSEDDPYEPLHPPEESLEELKGKVAPTWKPAWPIATVVILLLMTTIASGTAGFVLGNRQPKSPTGELESRTFVYQRQFKINN